MDSETASFNSTNQNQIQQYNCRGVPICGCREIMRLYISNSSDNPGRRYWKCARYNFNDSCKLFIWDDKLGRDLSVSQPCLGCKHSEVVIVEQKKKIEKLKLKVAREKSNKQYIWAILFVSWVLFLSFAISTYKV